MILHTVNKSLNEAGVLNACLRSLQPGNGIVLLEDGVYCSVDRVDNRQWLNALTGNCRLYVLEPDLKARGLDENVLDTIEKITYRQFVELCSQYRKVLNWC